MHSLKIQVTLTSDSPDKLTPSEAKRCLGAPAYVVVENADSDGAFLEAMIYAWQRRNLLDAQTEGWWKIESRGGTGEITKCVEQIRAETVGPLRVFVLCDSDRLYPGYLKKAIQTIENYCQHQKVPYAILQKREIENYLPLNLLEQVLEKQKVYQAFLHLTKKQRDFYDMKFGFKRQDDSTIVPPEQRDLFAELSPCILDDLSGGFGKKIGQLFKEKREEITAAAIKQLYASYPQEINNILDQTAAVIKQLYASDPQKIDNILEQTAAAIKQLYASDPQKIDNILEQTAAAIEQLYDSDPQEIDNILEQTAAAIEQLYASDPQEIDNILEQIESLL